MRLLPLLLTLLVPASTALAASLPQDAQDPGRPDLILVLSDDQGARHLGCAGHPVLRTPHLDRLGAEGAHFRAAFVTTALCAPARASFLTGRYARQHGVLANSTPLGAGQDSVAHRLRAAGYRTAYVGKWHLGGEGLPRPGFDRTASYDGQGQVTGAHFLVGAERLEERPTEGWVDDRATDLALEELAQAPLDQPLFLVLAFKAPHAPRQPAPRHRELYADATLPPLEPNGPLPPYPTPAEHRRLARAAGVPAAAYAAPEDWLDGWEGERLPEQRARRGRSEDEDRRNRWRQLAGLDENLGRLLAALKARGSLERTLLVYSSDNGMLSGRRGVFGKRGAYDEALAVPLLVRPPAGHTPVGPVNELVLNVDVAPTLLDYAGLEAPEAWPGLSLRPLLEGREVPWRADFLAEFEPSGDSSFPAVLALRSRHWKLVTYPGRPAWRELFDLQADPFELRNLAGQEEHAGTLARLAERLAELDAALGPREER